MPHIHTLFDFVVSAFIVHRGKVLLVYHKKYEEWLPIGGHIELDEDPEEALAREIREECGLKVRVLAKAPDIAHEGVKPIPAPDYMDVHRISPTHKHIAFIYFGVAENNSVRLHEREHREFRWFSAFDLDAAEYALTSSIRFYCQEALERSARHAH